MDQKSFKIFLILDYFLCELPEILQLNPAYIHSSAFRIKSMISSNERSLSTYASYNACFALSIFRSGCRSSSSVESSSARTLYSLCFLITFLKFFYFSVQSFYVFPFFLLLFFHVILPLYCRYPFSLYKTEDLLITFFASCNIFILFSAFVKSIEGSFSIFHSTIYTPDVIVLTIPYIDIFLLPHKRFCKKFIYSACNPLFS